MLDVVRWAAEDMLDEVLVVDLRDPEDEVVVVSGELEDLPAWGAICPHELGGRHPVCEDEGRVTEDAEEGVGCRALRGRGYVPDGLVVLRVGSSPSLLYVCDHSLKTAHLFPIETWRTLRNVC